MSKEWHSKGSGAAGFHSLSFMCFSTSYLLSPSLPIGGKKKRRLHVPYLVPNVAFCSVEAKSIPK